MKKVFKIETLEQFKTIMEPIRKQIFNLIEEEEFSVKDISDKLGEAPSKINYHVQEMAKAGFFTKTRTQKVKNLIKQFYKKSANSYAVSANFNKKISKMSKSKKKDLGDSFLLNYATTIHDDIIDHVNSDNNPNKKQEDSSPIIALTTAIHVNKTDLTKIGKEIDKIIDKYGKRKAGKNKQKLYMLSLPTK